MNKYDRVAKQIAGEALNWPPCGPCWNELWEEIRDILKKEFPLDGGGDTFLPLPAGFHDNNPKKLSSTEETFNSEEPHTFKEWSDHGYRIKKGEHASGRNEAMERTFKRDQVWKNNDRMIACYDDEEITGILDDYYDLPGSYDGS